MNVVDSSAWLEYFAAGPNAEYFAAAIEATGDLVVPSITLYEVFKRVASQRGESDALAAVAQMQQGNVVELSGSLALDSARTSLDLKLPMADSVILTTARAFDATLWTQDVDFEGVDGVMYASKASA
ncbi:MAG: type II toxin-antitoxin system VapC family toxin [Coriobacteriia bacterium]|nr:type II toxin-antitoxin system VapC family toxin [Coriobacteriia bacterium]